MKIKSVTIVKGVAIIMLFGALASNPYGYYQFLRLFICVFSGYLAYLASENKKNEWVWIFVVMAILFNPIIPIYLSRSVWAVLDVVSAVIIFASIFENKKIKS